MKTFLLIPFFIICAHFSSHSQTFQMNYDGLQRSYLVHLPTGYTGNEKLSLVIAMHGGFGSSENIERQSQLSVKADKEHFIVVYPQGYKGGVLKISGFNAGGCCGWTSKNNVDDVGFISAVLDELTTNFNIDSKRIYATGMSNGGMMAYRLACELPNRIAAIAPVASTMVFPDCHPNRSIPIIHFHSYLDTHVPYKGGIGSGPSKHYNPPIDSVLNAFAKYNHCIKNNDTIVDNDKYSLIQWSDCNCGYEIKEYMTHDGGHSWPGGQESGIVDTASIYISATDLMWDFFKKYSLDCKPNVVSEQKKSFLKLFPNPSTGIVTLDLNIHHSDINISVYDLMGHKVQVPFETNSLDFTKLDSGIYFVKLQFKHQVFIKKILIVR